MHKSATCAPPPWTAITRSNCAGHHGATRRGRHWADSAGSRQREWLRYPTALALTGEQSREGAVDGRVTTFYITVHRPVPGAGE
jgi:hypothetical protein